MTFPHEIELRLDRVSPYLFWCVVFALALAGGARAAVDVAGNIEGKVIIAGSGEPLAGVKLRLQGTDAAREPVLSGADGSFHFTGVPAGRAVITALFPGDPVADWVAEDVPVTVASGETRRDVLVRALKGGLAVVRVESEDDGKPLADVPVTFTSQLSESRIVAKTGSNGIARVRLLPDTWQEVAGGTDGRGTGIQTRFTVDTGQTTNLEEQVTPGTKITGTVRDPDGAPAGGVVVTIAGSYYVNGNEATTDANGQYELMWWRHARTANGRGTLTVNAIYYLTARSADGMLAALRQVTGSTTNQDLNLEGTVTLLARVVDSAGQPIENATMSGYVQAGNFGVSVTGANVLKPDSRGRIEVDRVLKGDNYRFTVSAEGYGAMNPSMPMPNPETNRLEFPTIVLPRADKKIAGQIQDADGNAAIGVTVQAWAISHVVRPLEGKPDAWDVDTVRFRSEGYARTDNQGRFLLDGVCEGPVELQLSIQGPAVTVQTTGGTTDIVLRLPNYRNNNNAGFNMGIVVADPVVKISGTVRDPSGAPAAGVTVAWGSHVNPQYVTTDSRGRYSISWPNGAGTLVMLARDEQRNLAASHEVDGTITNVDLLLDQGLTISVRALDTSGRPIPSALATLALVVKNSEWAITRGHAQADEQGRIEIKGVPQGMNYRCIVTSRGFGMVTAVLPLEATLASRRELPPAVLRVADRRVAGRVFDRNNQPYAHLTVGITGDGQAGAIATTDDWGRFVFDAIPAGKVRLSAGGASAEVQAGETNVALRFPTRDERGNDISTEMLTASGRVLDGSGAPVSNVLLTVLPDGGRKTELASDPDGQFMIGWRRQYCFNDGQMPPTVIARDPAHNLVGLHELDGKPGNLDLKLKPGLTLAIKAQDTKGEAIPAATGTLYVVSGNWMNKLNATPAQADVRGTIEFKGLPSGLKYRVTVAAKGYGVASLDAEPAQTRTNRYDFPAAVLKAANRDLAGHLFDAKGNPASGAVVILDGEGQPPASAVPDDLGRFSFGAVCEGPVQLLAGYSTHPPPITNVEAQAGDTNVVIRFQPAGQMVTTHGRVLDPSGAPVPGAHLTVFMAFMEGGKDAMSDEDGAYSIVWMSMNSTGPDGANLPALPYVLAAVDEERGLTAGAEIDRTTAHLDLHLQKPVTLTGSVLDSKGKPAANASVSLCIGRRESPFVPQQATLVDARGDFCISNLPPGQQYRLTVKADGCASLVRRLEPAETQAASLKLEPFVVIPSDLKLEGQVVDAKGKPVARAQVNLSDANQPGGNTLTDTNGHFLFNPVWKGPASLRALYDADGRTGSAVPAVSIEAIGGDTNIVIKLVLTNAVPAGAPHL